MTVTSEVAVPDGKNRTRPSTAVYRSVMLECERRRQQLGWPMWKLDEASGVQDGFYSKMLYADAPNGRQARWETLELIVSALFPEGYDIVFREKKGDPLSVQSMRQKIRFEKARFDPKGRRELMRELGKAGNAAYLIKVPSAKRIRIAKRAARARWRAKRQGAKHKAVNAAKAAAVEGAVT